MTRLLLIGAGHAHLGVLRAFAATPPSGVAVTLVTPHPRQLYSGMLPGWIAGHYPLDACAIALEPLAARAQATCTWATVSALDLHARVAYTDGGAALPFDLVSVDTGAVPDRSLPGAHEHAIALRPLESFVAAWQRLHVQAAADSVGAARQHERAEAQTLTLIGGGAAGVEIGLAIAHRAQVGRLPLRLQLVAGRAGVLPTLPPRCRARVQRQLQVHAIRVIDDDATAVERDRVRLTGGDAVATDVALLATGTVAADWPRAAGLGVDGRGFIAVAPTLQSLTHPAVFAAGDCASMIDHPRAKSGVYAVRAGPVLAANLLRALRGEPLRQWTPQRRALYLLSAGGKHAIASWNGISVEGAWAWRWKDRIDRGFVARYR